MTLDIYIRPLANNEYDIVYYKSVISQVWQTINTL